MDIHKIISDYLSGEISREDQKKLDQWLAEDPSHQDQLSSLMGIWKAPLDLTAIGNQNDERRKIWDRLNADQKVQASPGKRLQFQPVFLKYAAVIMLLVSVGYLYYHFQPREPMVAQKIVRSNPMGQKSKIQLPDGSRVWLNANSTLSYTTDYNLTTRSLYLEGEAFFEVVKNPDIPFKVHTNDLIITALGTSFNVHAFANHAYENIALLEGKVKVEGTDTLTGNTPPSFLSPGELAHFKNDNNKIGVSKIYESDPYGWKDGRISFHHASFEEVTEILARWYNVKFSVAGEKIPKWDYSGTFENEVLENVLESLKFSEKISYKIDGSNVEIKL